MSAVVVDGHLVHYETLGRGRPVVFLHGWLGSWRYWMETMDEMSIHYRTYAFDFWGFGDSAKVAERYTLGHLVQQLEAFLDELGIWKCDLVGHALGGLVALGFALRWPQRVGQLATVSLPFIEEAITSRLAKGNPTGVLDRVFRQRPLDYQALRAEAERADVEAIYRSLASLRGLDLRSQKPPARWLAIHGAKDDIVQPPDPKALCQDMARFRLMLFAQGRHFPMLEETAKFNRLLKDFLAGDALASLQIKEEWRRRTH